MRKEREKQRKHEEKLQKEREKLLKERREEQKRQKVDDELLVKEAAEDTEQDDVGYQIYDRHSKNQPSLVKSLILQFWKPTLLAMLLKLGNDLIQFLSPQLLR